MYNRSLVPIVAFALASPLQAEGPANADSVLAEIIVSAQRREENLQSVPISITAFSEERLYKSGVETTVDLQYSTPSFVFTTNSAFGQPYIRGVGSDLFIPAADASVATFVDDVYQTRSSQAVQDFYDVERVEVVKGPQGTLFGRNASGGAVSIITRKPEKQFHAGFGLLVGNFDKRRVTGVLNTPVVDDKVLFRVAGLYGKRDGFTDNIFLGDDLDDESVWSIRSHLSFLISDGAELTLSGDYTQEDSTRSLAAHFDVGGGSSIASQSGGTTPTDNRKVSINEDNFLDLEAWGLSAKLNIDFAWASITSITAYRQNELEELLDLDVTELDFASNQPRQTSETLTQEVRITSDTGSDFEWVGGVFYLTEDAFQTLDLELDFPIPGFGIRDRPSGDVKTTAYGIFFNGKYHFNERWAFAAGMRYNYDDREQDYLELVNLLADGSELARIELDQHEDFDAVTPKIVVEYTSSAETLFYGSASRGYKAGGFNSNTFQPAPFDPEKLWAYELGVKSTLAHGRVRLNAAAFYYDYQDLQLLTIPPGSPPGTFQVVINAAESTVTGLEADILAAPADHLELNFSFSLLDAKFDEFLALNPNDVASGEVDRGGERMPRAPKFAVNLGAQYGSKISTGRVVLRGEYRYQDDIFLDPFQDPLVAQEGYSIVNARLTYEHGDGKWRISAFGRNLADKDFLQSAIRVDGLFGNLQFFGPPRTFGLQFDYGL